MSRIVTLKIENCLDCPNSVKVSDPGSSDSFDASDESLCCKLTPVPADHRQTDRGALFPGRIIVACERWPSRMRKEAEVPGWCPLDQGSTVARG